MALIFQDLITNSSVDIRLQKKALFLVADLADFQIENSYDSKLPFLNDRLFLKSVVDLTSSDDLDLQEKVIFYISQKLPYLVIYGLKVHYALIISFICNWHQQRIIN